MTESMSSENRLIIPSALDSDVPPLKISRGRPWSWKIQWSIQPQPKEHFIPRLRDHRGHGEEMQAKTVGQQTRNRNLVIPARAGRSTFLCGLCALCGEFFLRRRRRRWPRVLQES